MDVIVTVVAVERPGIIEAVAAVVADHSGNWAESRLATMAGMFAGIIRIEVAEAAVGDLRAALESLSGRGPIADVTVRVVETAATPIATEHHRVNVVGNDRPGIVAEVSAALARSGVTVTDLTTSVEPASMSGGVLFRMGMEVGLTADQTIEAVRSALEEVSPDIMCDVAE